MPNKKISQLNSVDQLFGDEKLLITQSGTNKTSTVPVLGTKLNSDVGVAVSGLNSQNTTLASNARASITGIGSDLAASIGALHRSPNAITSMFVYDTSKDSDGGAWTEKCQHTSWYNETLSGKWLGAVASEFEARVTNATLGSELVTNGDFGSGSTTGWDSSGITSSNGTVTVTSGSAVITRGVGNAYFNQAVTTVVGKLYKFSGTVKVTTLLSPSLLVGTSSSNGSYLNFSNVGVGTSSGYFVAASTTTYISVYINGYGGQSITVDDFSVREVTQTTQSGDYYQDTTTGKFNRLYKNLLTYSQTFTNAAWVKGNATITSTTNTAPDGSATASKLVINSGQVADGGGALRYDATRSVNTVYTHSIYAKAGEWSFLRIVFRNSSGDETGASFDLSSGTKIATDTGVTADINNVGSGWYRCWITKITPGSSSVGAFRVYGGSTSAFGSTGDGASGIYVWGAQAEAGSLTSYEVKTTDTSVGEVFRGNKREFPKLSAIVAESSNVTIYDLTEPGRPMWMRFVKSGATWDTSYLGVGNCTTISALNGTVAIGQGDEWGLRVVQFQKDGGFRISGGAGSANRELRDYTTPVVGRNSTVSTVPRIPLTYLNSSTLSGTINAVAMTVLPDAPVDPVTSLQVPTIAVATAGGVSVIKHNGAVVSNSYATSFSGLSINKDLLSCFKTNSTEIYRAYNIGSLQAGFDLSADIYYNMPDFRNGTFSTLKQADRNILVRSVSGSATLKKLYNNPSAVAKGVATTITNTFNTGHQVGDIRRTYLSDINAGSVSGTELVTNGTFDAGVSGWSGSITWDSGGYAILAANGVISQAIQTEIGKVYKYTVNILTSGNLAVRVATTAGGLDILNGGSGAGLRVMYFTATTNITYLNFQSYSGISTFDDVSVKQYIADRSYKAKNADILGTLTKSPVATNAQLVGYSGFSAANYLREPYSADLDFGTGEWTASAWVNVPVALPALSAFPAVGPELITGQVISASGTLNLKVPPQYAGGFEVVVTNAISGLQLDDGAVWVTLGVGTYRFKRGYGCVLRNTSASIITLNASDISIKELGSLEVATRAHSSGARIGFGLTVFGSITATAFDGTTTRTVTSPNAYNTGTWNKVRVNYTTDGKLALLVNGVEVASATGSALLTLNNSNAVLTIGNNYAANAPFPGSLALVKFSATVPTTEQSQWMYEQEKAMFQPGAQVCLPSSNSVTDLTYDNLTDTWIAAQSTHISEWKGLVRTSYRKPASGSFEKLSAASGVRLMTRSSWGVDIEAQPVQLKKELFSSTDASINNQNTTTFDFDAVTSQTDFVLPVGYTAQAVFSAGVQIFEGSAGNKFTRLFDGFKETIRFATAPGNGVWVKIRAVRAQG